MIHGVVYKLESPIGKCYIGQTISYKRRLSQFRTNYKGLHYGGKKIEEAIEKFGAKNFKYEILFEQYFSNREEAKLVLHQKEEYYIEMYDTYKNGYNMTKGGSGTKGLVPTEENVKKSVERFKKYLETHEHPRKGVHLSYETKKKLSEFNKKRIGSLNPMYGKHLSEKQRCLLSNVAKTRTGEKNPFYNKSHKDSTKEKISEANSVAVIQLDKNTGEVLNEFTSALKAGEYLGNPRLNSEIIKCCRGYVSPSGKRYLTCKGYKWKYKE